MKNRRYVLVILDSAGVGVRRVGVRRSTLQFIAVAASLLLLGTIAAVTHGVSRMQDAGESVMLADENDEMHSLLGRLEAQIPESRRQSLRAEMTFAQLWSKGGLGIEPKLLGAGPFEPEGENLARFPGDDPVTLSGQIMASEPIALPLEIHRIEQDARRIQHNLGELLEYFHDAQRLLQNTPSTRPARTPWLTSGFGKRRDPVDGRWLMHKGIDIGGRIGCPINAPADGVVIWRGRRGGYGQTVVLDHGYGIQTHFAHLNAYKVELGQRVRRGEVIAEMGNTGKSTGPHLHYEVRRLGRPLDPMPFILD